MEIIKIVLVAIITAVITLYLKKYSPETAVLASVAGGLLIIFLIGNYLFDVVGKLKDFFNQSKIDSNLLKIIVKVTVVAYLVEFSAGIIKDLGETSLSEKVLLAGKITILAMSFPIINSMFNLLVKIING